MLLRRAPSAMARRPSGCAWCIVLVSAAAGALLFCCSPAARLLETFVIGRGPASRHSGGARCQRSSSLLQRQVTGTKSEVHALHGRSSLELVLSQYKAGKNFQALRLRLEGQRFDGEALDGRVKVSCDGLQNLRLVETSTEALEEAGGAQKLSDALLTAMQKAYDKSYASSKGDVWGLYQANGSLIQAPFSGVGLGGTINDAWSNVSDSEDSVKIAEVIFDHFDMDKDGYWNRNETSTVQLATEGTEMSEDSFVQLIIASAPEGGRFLNEQDIEIGLSRETVIKMYTDREYQRKLGFVLDVQRDYKKVLSLQAESEKAASEGDGASDTAKDAAGGSDDPAPPASDDPDAGKTAAAVPDEGSAPGAGKEGFSQLD